MGSENTQCGKSTKRIVFTDTDHRHAQLLIRLRHDGMTQAQFFRSIITGYIEGDVHICQFINQTKPQSLKRKAKSKKDVAKGQKTVAELGLDENQIENIFDLIAEEHPDL